MNIFLTKRTPPQAEPQAGPSGGVPEEDIVIIRDDSPMPVIAPGDLPVGQGVEVESSDIYDLILRRTRLMCVLVS